MRRLLFIACVLLLLAACSPAVPKFERWTTAQAAAAFQSAGLEYANPRPMTKEDYGLAPMNAEEGVRFFIPSLGPDNGGRLYSFESAEKLEAMRTYYVKLGEASAMFFSWVFVRDNVLVQINGNLPEAQARKYEAALQGMK